MHKHNKHSKKLVLATQTVRKLPTGELVIVAGGAPPSARLSQCPTVCF